MSKHRADTLRQRFLLVLGFLLSPLLFLPVVLLSSFFLRVLFVFTVAAFFHYILLAEEKKIPVFVRSIRKILSVSAEGISERPFYFGFSFGSLAISRIAVFVVLVVGALSLFRVNNV